MDLTYQALFILNFLVCFFLMKLLSWHLTPHSQRPSLLNFLVSSPYLSPRSLRVKIPAPRTSPWLSLLLYLSLMALVFFMVKFFLSPVGYLDRILLGLGIYFFTEALGSFGQGLFLLRSSPVFPIHHRPLSAPSLSQFWGRRWNLWVQDWISDLGRGFHRRPRMKILVSFLGSGLFHEAMVNLPHWISTGENYFGTMLAYFLIQGGGLYVDKRWVSGLSPLFRRLYGLLVVTLPAPLFINVPVLRFFGVTE